MSQIRYHFSAITLLLLILALALTLPHNAHADNADNLSSSIIKQLESGNKQQALRKLRTLRNKHYAGFNVEGKTCRQYPEFILMVALESSIRNKQKDQTINYLTQLQCLIDINKLSQNEQIHELVKNRHFKPDKVHLCPFGLGDTQIQNAKRWQATGKTEKAKKEALRAACLLGMSNPEVSALITPLLQSEQTPQPTIKKPTTPAHSTKPDNLSNESSQETQNYLWIFVAIGALAMLLMGVMLKRRNTKAGIFISYRRRDSAGWAQTIHDKLAEELGHEEIFMDLHDIPAGADFVEHLDQTLKDIETVIVVIGPEWEAGERIHNEDDWVRQEIVHAMHSKKQVIPVLVDHRRMPSPGTLPEDLRPMTRLNAITLYPDQLDAGIKRILAAVN